MTPEIEGYAAEGFEPVRARFADCIAEVGDGGAAFAASLDGTQVVDLWTAGADRSPWRRETRAVLMSATKGVATAAVATLVDRGELELEQPVARWWPEFAAAGKRDVTVEQVLAHTAGIVTVPGYEDLLDPSGAGWDRTEEIVRRLAAGAPAWAPGSAFGYHGLTFGWLVGELVRRSAGTSIGALVRERLVEPLGLELDLGTPVERQALVAPVSLPGGVRVPQPGVDELLADPASLPSRMLLAVGGRSLLDTAERFFADPQLLALELAGSNATGTARALATLYGTLACAGAPGVPAVVSRETIDAFTAERAAGIDAVMGSAARRGLGFELAVPAEEGPSEWGPHAETFGHRGYGGQIGFGDPAAGVGVGFVRTALTHTSSLAGALVEALYACLDGRGANLKGAHNAV